MSRRTDKQKDIAIQTWIQDSLLQDQDQDQDHDPAFKTNTKTKSPHSRPRPRLFMQNCVIICPKQITKPVYVVAIS